MQEICEILNCFIFIFYFLGVGGRGVWGGVIYKWGNGVD